MLYFIADQPISQRTYVLGRLQIQTAIAAIQCCDNGPIKMLTASLETGYSPYLGNNMLTWLIIPHMDPFQFQIDFYDWFDTKTIALLKSIAIMSNVITKTKKILVHVLEQRGNFYYQSCRH